MTEMEWHTCGEPESMLSYLRKCAGNRKLRLFAVACCRGIWPLLIDERSRQAVELAEKFADGSASRAERIAARTAALAAAQISARDAPTNDRDAWWHWRANASSQATAASAAQWSVARSAYEAAYNCSRRTWYAKATAAWAADRMARVASNELWSRVEREEKARQVAILYDLVGNPFRSIGPSLESPGWRTDEVARLARTIDEEHSYDQLPLLAEKLREAGCGEQHLIEHCRQGTVHVRGCWALDLLLEKK